LLFGRPCVSYAAGGIPEVMSLPEAKDWLVRTGDEDAFAERLVQVINLSDTELKNLEPILEAHARRFAITGPVRNIQQFYHRVFQKLGKTAPTETPSRTLVPAR